VGIKRFAVAAIAGFALMVAVAVGPMAGLAAAKKPIQIGVGADRNAPVDPETGERPDPYVIFQIRAGAIPGRLYRIVTEEGPSSTAALPCNPNLTTQWYPAFDTGDLTFPTEPVGSGTYLPFGGQQPCEGSYVMEVQERRNLRRPWRAVRAFAFNYPSFSFSFVPLDER
jgi:hypothetical protein